ncbi:MAG: DnaJ domain-containing protein [Myxococcota bacterium]|nr:DnaJ domain-containing protein [Myxococcota bacterium]
MDNAYEVLGVSPGVDEAAVKRQYRERLQHVHPDMNPDDPHAAEKTKRLVEAYEVLSNPAKRSALDATLRAEAEKKRRQQRDAEKRRRAAEQQRRAASQRTTQQEREARGAARARARRTRRTAPGPRGRQDIRMDGTTIIGNGNIHITVNGKTVHSSESTAQSHRGGGAAGSDTRSGVYHGNMTIPAGSKTVISGQVMGNVLVAAGSTVTISGQVMGNVIVSTGSEIVINGEVMGHVTAPGSNVAVYGVLMGNLIVGSGNAKIQGVHMGRVV